MMVVEFVHQVLASQDECEIVKEMPSQGKDVVVQRNMRVEKVYGRQSLHDDPKKKNMSCFETKCKISVCA